MNPTTTPNRSRRRHPIIPGLLVLAIVASSCGDSPSNSDDEQVCRVAQRLVDETADGDADGIERQLERLEELDGVGERTDLGDLEDLAEIGDEDALDDLADQIDDDFECGVDIPRLVEVTEATPVDTVVPATEPAETEPVVTTPPVTEPPVTEAPQAEPSATEPPASDPPVTEAPTPSSAPSDGEALVVVDIGADNPTGLDVADIAQDPAVLVAESGAASLPIPAGEAIGIEYNVDYVVNDFSDTAEYSVFESATFVAATDQSIEEVRDAFSSAIISATGVDYEVSESSASRDETTQSAVDLRPDFGSDDLTYEVIAAESTESPGLVFIEVSARGNREGPLPQLTAVAAAQMGPAVDIGATLGWELSSWSWGPSINQFNGDSTTSGRLMWAIGTGLEADVAARSAELLELLPAPDFEDIESDREFYIVNDNENWTVRYSDVFEGAELRANYSYSA